MTANPIIDPECVALCDALNNIPGVQTFWSCSGHKMTPIQIRFRINNIYDNPQVPNLLRSLDYINNGWRPQWKVLMNDSDVDGLHFILEGPIGDFIGAGVIANAITRQTKYSTA